MAAMRLKIVAKTIFLLGFVVAAKGQDNPLLSVRVLEKLNPTGFQVQCPAEKGVWNEVKLTRGQLRVNGKAQTGASWGKPDSTFKIRFENVTRIYPGLIEVSAKTEKDGPKLFILNKVPLENYAACVLAFESGFDKKQPEYLKALGVIVRAYALSHRARHPGYDLCDLTHCQAYQGLPSHLDFWEEMVEAGRSYQFPSNFDLKSLFFHRCCGGSLESSDQIWGGPPSPSRTGPDALKGDELCRADTFFHWTSSAEVAKVGTVLCEMAHLPLSAQLIDLKVTAKTAHYRNKTFSAIFQISEAGNKEIRENAIQFISEFGKRYGWRVFPSDWFDIQKDGDLFRFTGHGLGHGVGLCQSGAAELARIGWSWKDILNFYFPAN